jgi:hypothetical protein
VLALTVRPPSSHAIAEGWQTIESRDWAPQRRGLLAIHAGTHWDWRAHRRIERLTPAADLSTTVTGAVVAVAVLSGVHHSGSCRRLGRYAELHPDGPWTCSRWAADAAWHWELGDVRRLEVPVECRGWQRLWRLPASVEAQVRAQLGVTV